MALQALWAPETQFQNKNGSLLVSGKIYVKYRGRSQLARTYRDSEGTYLNQNPLLTDNDGRVLCFADDAFSYTAVVCDFYGNELFSFDPIPCGSSSGSGSSSSSSAQHWIGINGQTQQVSRNTYTRLKLPSGLDNVDYEGDFVLGTIKGSGTEMVLKEGLYLVNTVIRFKQSSDDLANTLSNVIIHTRDFDTPNIQEVGAVVRDEAGPDASDDIHTITLTYIRHVSEGDVGSDRIKFAVETPNTWTECYIQNLQIAKLGSSAGESVPPVVYYAGDYISIENDTISVTGIEPENYATHDELHSATSAFITSADLPDLSGYATEQWVLDKHYITSADIPGIPEDLVTSAELAHTSGLIEKDIADLTSSISEAIADKMDKSSSAYFYPRHDNPEGYLTSIPSEYVTESEMSGYVQDHTSGFITSADIPDIPDDVVTSGELATVSGEIVNQIPSLQGYATEDYVTEHTSAFLTSADLPSTEEVQFEELDLSGYATESYVASAVSGKQDALTFGYDSSDKINAINGSAIAGGGSVPEGVMVESGIQYNAVGEISGYGDSAIAQYGAEKQWLVHDDTIVHVTNYAQYAFGVNLSAVAQLLGIDETVLFENASGTSAFTTSEPITNFDRVRFYINSDPSATISEVEVPMMGNNLNKLELSWNDYWKNEGNFHVMNWQSKISNSGMSAFSISDTYYMGTNRNNASDNGQYYPRSGTTDFAPWFYKVVGIGRKQSN